MEYLKIIVTSSVISGVLIWLLKNFISQSLKKDLESYKVNLKHEYEMVFERYKQQLSRESFEHQVKQTHLLEKRADVLAETYTLLRAAFNCIAMLVDDSKCTDELYKEAKDAIDKIVNYYPSRRIFISHEIADKIDRFRVELARCVQDFESQDDFNQIGYRYDKVHKHLSKQLTDIEYEFRSLIGENI